MIERTLRENVRSIRALPTTPTRALEVGALPGARGVLANTPEIADRVGVNLTLEGDAFGVKVSRGDARDLPWPDRHFDLVVCASTLEHIPDFWRAVAEFRRVLAPGGHLLISTPGYADHRIGRQGRALAAKLHLPDILQRGTITMRIHDQGDYYRFSEQAYREVLLAGLADICVWRIMTPPRIFGLGTQPHDDG